MYNMQVCMYYICTNGSQLMEENKGTVKILFLRRISKLGHYYETHNAFRFLNSSPKSAEVEMCTGFLNGVPSFPNGQHGSRNGYPDSRKGYLVSRNEYPVSRMGYPVF